ncbi:hypothetical protein KKA00_02635 [bacterium]|nr:hypothetical protein [bacterium]
MKRLLFLTALLMALLTLALGCSDDEETPTGGTDLVQGDTNDPGFQFVDSTFESVMFDWFDGSMGLAFALMDSVLGQVSGFHRATPMSRLGISQELDIIIKAGWSFEYTETGWFVFVFEAIVTHYMDPDTTEIAGIDSIQWLRDGMPLDTLDSDIEPDALKTRAHIDWSRGDEASGASHQRLDLETEVVSEGPVPVGGDTMMVINATVYDTVEASSVTDTTSCTLDLASSTVVENVRTAAGDDEEDGCPETGIIAVSAAMQLSCTGSGAGWLNELEINGDWTASITFIGNNMATVRFANATTVWTYTGPCD